MDTIFHDYSLSNNYLITFIEMKIQVELIAVFLPSYYTCLYHL
jgi:hypothetical protein